LVKAAAGGGGKGMRIVRAADELPAALESARRESARAFADDRVFLEKYIDPARHIEFQIFADTHGGVLHLYERECSVQRRHQKIIEESPSPYLTTRPDLREAMGAAAVAAARSVGYVNAGTVEFIVDPRDGQYYFLEMNTRLQVEHPVTELVLGLDLVHWQFQIAAGGPLPLTQAQIVQRGHAIECRLYAEDAAADFLPATGTLLRLEEPRAPGVRIDSGLRSGDTISHHYDPMIAKLIAHAATREEAIRRALAALAEYTVLGVTTNIAFLRDLLAHPDFARGETTTDLIARAFSDWRPASAVPSAALVGLALAEALGALPGTLPGAAESASVRSGQSADLPPDPWARADGFRVGGAL
jgi:acetyl/propionyl-CoA carboxylase alpha subunit